MGAKGKIIQILGPVVDLSFPSNELPEIYNALHITGRTDAGQEIDLVLTMEEHHAEAARRLAPGRESRIHLLARYAAEGNPAVRGGVPDPIGGDLEDYRLTFVEIREQIAAALPRLEREIGEAPVEA